MMGDYKKYKASLRNVPTGGGELDQPAAFIRLLDQHMAEDVRVAGIDGAEDFGMKEMVFIYLIFRVSKHDRHVYAYRQ